VLKTKNKISLAAKEMEINNDSNQIIFIKGILNKTPSICEHK
jgi:hypothetical protein